METKEQKFARFQKTLELHKKQAAWALIITIVFSGMIGEVAYIHNNIFLYVVVIFSICFLMIILLFTFIKEVNITSLEKELRDKIKEAKESLETLKKEYVIIISWKFNDIPPNLRETARYLLSYEDLSPRQIIAQEKETIEEMEIQLKVYQKSSERNFWQYFMTWKWLKKIPQQM